MARTSMHVRETFNPPRTGTPELLSFGWERQTAARHSLSSHTHRDAYEFCYIVDGRVDWWAEGEVCEVAAGDIYFTRPEEQHGGIDGIMHPSELYWMLVAVPGTGAMTGLTPQETATLAQGLAGMRQRCFRGSEVMPAQWRTLHQQLRQTSPLRTMGIRAGLHAVLLEVLRCHDVQRDRTRAISTPIRHAMAWIDQHAAEDLPIESAGEKASLRASQFHDRFRREVGLTPAAYRTRHRVRAAKHLLRDPNLSITEVALRAGFGTSQYFATVFKRMAGMSPGAYRRQLDA